MEQTRRTGGSLAFESAKMPRRVWCESEVERRFFARLDGMKEVLWFQEQPLSIRYKLNGKRRTYYPDALAVFTDGTSVLIEIKPAQRLVDFENIVKYAAMLERCESEGWGTFIGNARMSFRSLIQHQFKPLLLPALRTELKTREISSEWLKWLKGIMGVSTADVNAAFLKLGLVVESSPFIARIARPGEGAVIDSVLRYFGDATTQSAESDRVRRIHPPTQSEAASRVGITTAAARRAHAQHSSTARLEHPNAYMPWTPEEERILLSSYAKGMTIPELAKLLGRNRGAIRSRLKKLNEADGGTPELGWDERAQ
jgi:hypothetical protein